MISFLITESPEPETMALPTFGNAHFVAADLQPLNNLQGGILTQARPSLGTSPKRNALVFLQVLSVYFYWACHSHSTFSTPRILQFLSHMATSSSFSALEFSSEPRIIMETYLGKCWSKEVGSKGQERQSSIKGGDKQRENRRDRREGGKNASKSKGVVEEWDRPMQRGSQPQSKKRQSGWNGTQNIGCLTHTRSKNN